MTTTEVINQAIAQNDPRCNPDMRAIGCFGRSSMFWAELKAGKCLTPDEINAIWDWAKEDGFISQKNDVRESAPIMNHTLKVLGYPGRFYEVGTFEKGKLNWYASVPQNMRRIDACIQKIKQNGPSKTHFRPVTRNGALLWDPHDPEIKVQGVFYSVLYCYA